MSSEPEHIIRLEDIGSFLQTREFLLGSSEHELVVSCKAGKREAQKRVYELFAGKMLNVCRRYAHDGEQARDLMHDGFIKVFLHIEKFREQSSLETWITRIMVNNCISAIKKEVRRGIRVSMDHIHIKDENVKDFELIEKQPISAKQVFEKLNELPLGYKTVLSMNILDGYTHKEIGEQLGISEGTSKSQLSKAKKLLAKLLTEAYL